MIKNKLAGDKFDEILQNVSSKLKGSDKYDDIISKTVSDIQRSAQNIGIEVDVFIGGSYAKGTYIGESFDVDIFVRFYDDSEIPKLDYILKPVSEKLNSKLDRIHGSRDYFQIKYDTIIFELIPVKYIEDISDAGHIMDYSPFHVKWIKEELSKKFLSEDIKLMKQFLKSCRAYGAESYISGFSGHISDILILYYGGFINTLKEISSWDLSEKKVIDYMGFYSGKDVFFFMNKSKLQSPLIVVDPIDKDRNAAAALREKAFVRAINASKDFLENPSESFFVSFNLDKNYFITKYPSSKVFVDEVFTKEGKLDVAGAKLVKALDYIELELKRFGFEILDIDWDWDKKKIANIFIVIKSDIIPEFYLRKGPNLSLDSAVSSFRVNNKGKEFVEKDSFLYVKEQRQFTNVRSALDFLYNCDYIRSRIIFHKSL